MPAEFIETTFPARIEKLSLAPDSGGPGRFRGGLGYCKEIRVLSDALFLSVADRSILSCWGLKGGRAGAPFKVTVDPDGPNERVLTGLVNDHPVTAGELVRIETTGGGGWGDPLERDPEMVVLDVIQGKVTRPEDYGVVLKNGRCDGRATDELRAKLRAERGDLPFFDRGPGYERLSGRKNAEVDWL
jgi:N-methylhydantoinase B